MGIHEFNDCEFGQTWTWLSERSKAAKHQREQIEEGYYMERMNTWIIARTFGLKQERPQDLYSLPSETPAISVDPFGEEANSLFDKWDSATPKGVIPAKDLKDKLNNGNSSR